LGENIPAIGPRFITEKRPCLQPGSILKGYIEAW
jgi:hypothetical protein